MKILTLITTLLIVGVVLFAISQMINEAESVYGVEFNDSNWQNDTTGLQSDSKSTYDFTERVNTSITPVKDELDKISNEDSGWITIITSGFTGVIKAMVVLPVLFFITITTTTELLTGIGSSLHIPGYILLVFITILFTWGILKLISIFNRWNES